MNRIAAAAVLPLLVSPVTLLAQTLADKVPADAIVYAGFKGSDALSAPYAPIASQRRAGRWFCCAPTKPKSTTLATRCVIQLIISTPILRAANHPLFQPTSSDPNAA